MVSTNYFTDVQAQFEDSQKKFAKIWEDAQKQLIESQKQLASKWLDSLPAGAAQISFTENAEKALNFQQELVHSALSVQQTTTSLLVETQKQFWENYFRTAQQTMKPPSALS